MDPESAVEKAMEKAEENLEKFRKIADEEKKKAIAAKALAKAQQEENERDFQKQLEKTEDSRKRKDLNTLKKQIF